MLSSVMCAYVPRQKQDSLVNLWAVGLGEPVGLLSHQVTRCGEAGQPRDFRAGGLGDRLLGCSLRRVTGGLVDSEIDCWDVR